MFALGTCTDILALPMITISSSGNPYHQGLAEAVCISYSVSGKKEGIVGERRLEMQRFSSCVGLFQGVD
jgi:hypothetical protein